MDKRMERVYLSGLKNLLKQDIWEEVFKYTKENKTKYTDDQLNAIYDILDVINEYDVNHDEELNEDEIDMLDDINERC